MCDFCKNGIIDESENCEYLDLYSNALGARDFAFINFNGCWGVEIALTIKGIAYSIPIDYCPKCGRKLRRD